MTLAEGKRAAGVREFTSRPRAMRKNHQGFVLLRLKGVSYGTES